MKIGIIGLGLIGGSFAITAKKYIEDCECYGDDINKNHLNIALELNINRELRDALTVHIATYKKMAAQGKCKVFGVHI